MVIKISGTQSCAFLRPLQDFSFVKHLNTRVNMTLALDFKEFVKTKKYYKLCNYDMLHVEDTGEYTDLQLYYYEIALTNFDEFITHHSNDGKIIRFLPSFEHSDITIKLSNLKEIIEQNNKKANVIEADRLLRTYYNVKGLGDPKGFYSKSPHSILNYYLSVYLLIQSQQKIARLINIVEDN